MVGSPGFTKDNFYQYLKDLVSKKTNKFLSDVLGLMVTTHCSSGFKHSLNEMMNNEEVQRRIQNMSCAQENKILDKYFELLAIAEDKVTYGPKSVTIALREMAVETLLISDKLFRAKNVEQRKFYVQMHDDAVRDGIQVVVFNSMTPAGERLNNLTGVAATLRMAFPELEDLVEGSDDGDLNSDEDGEIGASQASDTQSIGAHSKASSAAAGSVNAHEVGSDHDYEEEYKTEDKSSAQDQEEFDIDKMIEDLDDDYDFM